MRRWVTSIGLVFLAAVFALAQAPPVKAPAEFGNPSTSSAQSPLEALFQTKIRAEWEAIKAKDKKAYADLLADDYQGVEVDGGGERTKIQAINELVDGNIYNYTLWGFKLISLNPDAAFVIYEVTMQFPPKSTVRLSRVYITELWVRRSGEWKELHYQETHVK
jgi:ketosteroid isomerase-like protein